MLLTDWPDFHQLSVSLTGQLHPEQKNISVYIFKFFAKFLQSSVDLVAQDRIDKND